MARVLYLSQSYVPSRRADSVQVMHMCDAMVASGHELELVTKDCPSRFEPRVLDDHDFYGIEARFPIRKLPRPKPRGGGLLFAASVSRRIRRGAPRPDLSYCRYLWAARESVRVGVPTVFEAHGVPRGGFAARWFQEVLDAPSFKGLVVITSQLQRDLGSRFRFDDGLAIVAPDAVRRAFVDGFSEWSPPAKRPRVGYVGHLYPGRGIPTIFEVARRMPNLDFEIAGGHDDAVASWRRSSPPENVDLSGFVPPRDLVSVYTRMDILLMPHERRVGVQSGRSDIARWTSPMKMFEYMASGRPIVASRLPVLEEVLEHGRNALLVECDEVDAWESAIRRLSEDPLLAQRIGAQARQDVLDRYTWDTRAKAILTRCLK